MLRAALHVGRVQLLAGGLHLHRRLPGNRGRPLADQLADLAHSRQLLCLPYLFAAVVAADAAPGLLGGLLRFILSGALALRILPVLLIAFLTLLRVGLLGIALLAVFRLLLLLAVLLALPLLGIL